MPSKLVQVAIADLPVGVDPTELWRNHQVGPNVLKVLFFLDDVLKVLE
jgi:hypothetical protein